MWCCILKAETDIEHDKKKLKGFTSRELARLSPARKVRFSVSSNCKSSRATDDEIRIEPSRQRGRLSSAASFVLSSILASRSASGT